MSFYTTVSCYREGPQPPSITGDDLVNFCQQIIDTDFTKPDTSWWLRLKYGRAIDQDDLSTHREEQISQKISVMKKYDWDVDNLGIPPAEAMQLLQHPPRKRWSLRGDRSRQPIYRALIKFGDLRDEYTTTIQHQLAGNALFLGELFLRINVIKIADPDEGNRFEVGWMALEVGGNGYPFPWSYEETMQRIREHPQLTALRELCRSFWPASERPVASEIIEARRLMGRFWSEPLDVPYDWHWVIQGCV